MKSSRKGLLEPETFIKAATNPLQELVGRRLILIGNRVESVGVCGHGTVGDAKILVVGECQN
jgi:hypothetical protein